MPEAVEIRKFADILRSNILHSRITKINILKGRYTKKPFEGYDELCKNLPLTIESINTKGKFTYMTLVNENKSKFFYLFNTLGLSGGWTLKSSKKSDFTSCASNICQYMTEPKENVIFTYPVLIEYITEENQNEWFKRALNHLNVEFITDKKTKNNTFIIFYFYDQLSFGTLKAINGTDNNSQLEKKLKELGPDLMETTFDIFKTQMRKKINESKMIGNVIVNQKIVSGVGNYLRADGLWMAKISPFRKVSEVSDKELELLFWSLLALMWGDYNNSEGMKKGLIKYKIPNDYKRDFFVYMQKTDINGKKISKEELFEGAQKRFIYWCKDIQV
jgi:formamidopyrimidine-DNA glycosylase